MFVFNRVQVLVLQLLGHRDGHGLPSTLEVFYGIGLLMSLEIGCLPHCSMHTLSSMNPRYFVANDTTTTTDSDIYVDNQNLADFVGAECVEYHKTCRVDAGSSIQPVCSQSLESRLCYLSRTSTGCPNYSLRSGVLKQRTSSATLTSGGISKSLSEQLRTFEHWHILAMPTCKIC